MDLLHALFITAFPGIELRGAIPFVLASGGGFSEIVFVLLTNMLLFFPTWMGLNLLYRFVRHRWIVKRVVGRIRREGEPYVEKYGTIGIAFFVAMPLPGSGVYSGTVLAWLLGLGWRRTLASCISGVVIAGILVYAFSSGVFVVWNGLNGG